MTYLETLLKSATAEAKSMLNENIRLNDQIKSLQVTLDRTTIKLNHIAMIADDLKSRLCTHAWWGPGGAQQRSESSG